VEAMMVVAEAELVGFEHFLVSPFAQQQLIP
jgi:hypothetical protein